MGPKEPTNKCNQAWHIIYTMSEDFNWAFSRACQSLARNQEIEYRLVMWECKSLHPSPVNLNILPTSIAWLNRLSSNCNLICHQPSRASMRPLTSSQSTLASYSLVPLSLSWGEFHGSDSERFDGKWVVVVMTAIATAVEFTAIGRDPLRRYCNAKLIQSWDYYSVLATQYLPTSHSSINQR